MGYTDISLRLETIAGMVTPGSYLCDVGCDHGFLPIYLVKNGIINKALAMDIGEGPLKAAGEHISENGLDDSIETMLSDGLHGLTPHGLRSRVREKCGNHTPESLVIAGMGGPLILKILAECPDVRDEFDEIIISPQSHISDVRTGLKTEGLELISEAMVLDADKYYTVMKLVPAGKLSRDRKSALRDRDECLRRSLEDMGCTGPDRVTDGYGPDLLYRGDAGLVDFLGFERNILEGIIDQLDPAMHGSRYIEVKEQLKLNEYAGMLAERRQRI